MCGRQAVYRDGPSLALQARVLEGLAEIPDERLAWKPTRASTSAVEITWHMASAERRLAARLA